MKKLAALFRRVADRLDPVPPNPWDLSKVGAVERPDAFKGYYDKIEWNQSVTHYCPTCGGVYVGNTHTCHGGFQVSYTTTNGATA